MRQTRSILQRTPLSPAVGQPGQHPLYWPNAGCESVNSKHMADHLERDRYGDFWLTDAIRPALDRRVVPTEGYRVETYRDRQAGFQVPVLVAAVSRERLFDVFLDLLDPLGEVVDVVLETSHDTDGTSHQDLFREHIDLAVLKSHCCDFEEVLLHDGC